MSKPTRTVIRHTVTQHNELATFIRALGPERTRALRDHGTAKLAANTLGFNVTPFHVKGTRYEIGYNRHFRSSTIAKRGDRIEKAAPGTVINVGKDADEVHSLRKRIDALETIVRGMQTRIGRMASSLIN